MFWVVVGLVCSYILFLQYTRTTLDVLLADVLFWASTFAFGFYGWSLYWVLPLLVLRVTACRLRAHRLVESLFDFSAIGNVIKKYYSDKDAIQEENLVDFLGHKPTMRRQPIREPRPAFMPAVIGECFTYSWMGFACAFTGSVLGGP